MAHCEQCGSSLRPESLFCGTCGTAVVKDDDSSGQGYPPLITKSARWVCRACEANNSIKTQYCTNCGTARAASQTAPGADTIVEVDEEVTARASGSELTQAVSAAGTVSQADQSPSQSSLTTQATSAAGESVEAASGGDDDGGRGKRRQRIMLIVGAAALIIIAIAVGATLLIIKQRGEERDQARATFADQSIAIMQALEDPARRVAAAVPKRSKYARWDTKLTDAISAAEELEAGVADNQVKAAALQPLDETDRAIKAQIEATLKALTVYARSVASLPPDLSRVSASQAANVKRDAATAQRAVTTLKKAAPALPVLQVSSAKRLAASAHKAKKDTELRTFLVKIQNDILNQSQNGRGDIAHAVYTVDHQEMAPNEAAVLIDGVISNRQSLLDQLSAMSVPSDSRASEVYDLLQKSLQNSIEADRYYSMWMMGVYEYFYREPEGYMGTTPHDENYKRAIQIGDVSGDAKRRFCAKYNPLARSLGLQSDWTADRI